MRATERLPDVGLGAAGRLSQSPQLRTLAFASNVKEQEGTSDDHTPETPITEPPLCDEPEFAALTEELVADLAPRLFALVEEMGERVDSRVFAWGMAFEDRAEVVGAEWAFKGSFESAEVARQLFSRHGTMHLVWYNPDAATPDDRAP